VHQAIPEPKPIESPMPAAEQKLMTLIHAGQLHALRENGGKYEDPPPDIFEFAVVVTARDDFAPDPRAPEDDILAASDYIASVPPGKIVFRTSEVRECLALSAAPSEAAMSSDREPPDFPAPPRGWISFQAILARPSRLLPGDPETLEHPLDDAIRKELFRAAPAGLIRHELLLSGHLNTLEGLLRDPIDERLLLAPEHWDRVDRVRGVLEHPPGISRVINLCFEDAQAHIHTWLQQKQPPKLDPPPPEELLAPGAAQRQQEAVDPAAPEGAPVGSGDPPAPPEVPQTWSDAVQLLIQQLRGKDALVWKPSFIDWCMRVLENCGDRDARQLYATYIAPACLGAAKGGQHVARRTKFTRGETVLKDWTSSAADQTVNSTE
jgi:hypothetical protein